MRKLTKAAGLLFLAASSVYFEGVIWAAGGGAAKSHGTSVKALDDATDPFAGFYGTKSTTKPSTTQPAGATTRPGAVASKPIGANDVAFTEAGTVEIHVDDANLVEVLKMLSLQSQRNIVASKDVRGTVTANLYDVTIKEALDAILKSNGYDYREKGNFIYVYTAKELADQEKASIQPKTELFRLFYTPAANAANMIKPVLSSAGQVAFTTPAVTGISSDDKDAGGNAHASEDVLVVTDLPANLELVRKVLKEVDRRPQQILVEATILQATLQDNNDLGVDFTALGGVDFATLSNVADGGSTGGGLSQALNGSITQNKAANNVNDSGFIAGQAGGGGLKLGIVKNNVGMFLSALEGVTDTVILANPKVLVLNKQRGEVHVGTEQGYRTAVTTETLTADNVQFLETGTRLIFRPYVGDDGFIRLEIHPEDSSGAVNAQGLPNKTVTQVTSNVMVRDGHTIVIGGLFREATSRTRSQVPGLGSLPGIGTAFRHQTDDAVRQEVIILLTPHLVKDESAYSEASEKVLKDGDRLRVGIRKGLMPWGADRMADCWYESAVDEMNKPKPDYQKVLWNLNAATNLNPTFGEALALKVRVTGHEQTMADQSMIRSFLTRQVLADRAAGRAVTTPAPTVMISPTTQASTTPSTTGVPAAAPAAPAAAPVVVSPVLAPAAPRNGAENGLKIEKPDTRPSAVDVPPAPVKPGLLSRPAPAATQPSAAAGRTAPAPVRRLAVLDVPVRTTFVTVRTFEGG